VEAVQARGLDHPGIVRTYKTTTVLVQVRDLCCSSGAGVT
jgi:hypothetical protein